MGKENNPRRVAENEAFAKTEMLRTSPQKLNLVAQLIRGKKVDKALADLTFSHKRVAGDVKKCLQSAIANAQIGWPGCGQAVQHHPQRDGQPWQYQAVSAATRLDAPGAHTYVTRCASCHGLDGKGQAEWMPPLVGATSALARESASAINITGTPAPGVR